MKQLNFRHFNTNRKKFTVTVNFSQKETKTAPKRPILFCLVLPRRFQTFSISEEKSENPVLPSPFEHRLKVHGPIFEEQIRIYNTNRLWVFIEKPSKQLTVFSPETVNIKNLANLTGK